MKFPKTLYVKIDSDADNEWFLADSFVSGLVTMGERTKIATYQLVEIGEAQGVAQFVKPPPRRKRARV